ncbi:alginate export family protein [Roseovarius tibetensis]|uniref:alginate export family protein n=1 Tax=Roseovarius tibetensis TaxID=2685897 RepID=UPI003D7F6DBA
MNLEQLRIQPRPILMFACAICLLPPTFAVADEDEVSDFLERFEIERTLEINAETLRNRDLDDATGDELSALRPELVFEIAYEVSDKIEAFLELETEYRTVIERGRDRSPQGDEVEFNVKAFYLDFEDIRPGLSFRLGRQEVQDRREWLYDADLDGIRFLYERERLAFEIMAGRELAFKENLLEPKPEEDKIDNYAATLSFAPSDDHLISAYTFFRNGREDLDEDPVYIGLRAHGDATDRLSYWGNAVMLRGRADGNRLRGTALDIGATYRIPGTLEPSLTLAYAYGSGDPDPSGGIDRQFRQTGLHDNTYRFNGVEDFRYYGETLDPDLSNLEVFTVGLGVRPTERSSIDLTYHRYRQDEVTEDDIPGARVRPETNGESRDIGHGVNLILGYQDIEDVRLRAKFGWFFPGKAFDAADNAFSVELGVEVEF